MEEKLKDITDCCICLETYKEPKVLPCIHTYCKGCLEEVGAKTNRCPGDGMPCPICRKEFTIPENGFSGLQKNFFMDRLVEIRKTQTPSMDRTLCDLCLEDGDIGGIPETPSAEVLCADCHMKLCHECCRHHRKSKLTKYHKIIDLEDHMIKEDYMETVLPTFCYQHDGKALEIYCSTCQEVVCAQCFFEFHKTHDGLHVNNIVDDFREKIQKNTEHFHKYVTDLVEEINIAQKVTDAYIRKTEDVEVDINAAREELKKLVSKHSESLLLQLKLLKRKRLKEFEIRKDEIETLIASLESFETYCKQITAMGSARDICGVVSNLSKRSEELTDMYKATKESGTQLRDISLKRAAIGNSDDDNIIGKIEDDGTPSTTAGALPGPTDSGPELSRLIICQAPLDSDEEYDQSDYSETEVMEESSNNDALIEQLMEEVKELQQDLESMKQKEMERERVEKELGNYKPTPRAFKKITRTVTSTGRITVTGMAILDNELFISTKKSRDIEVYDSTNYAFRRLFRLSELNDPWDMCSSSRHKCLYIASGYNCSDDMRFEATMKHCFQQKPCNFYGKILKINVTGNIQHAWYIGEYCGTLSITGEGNILLTVPAASKIVVYDADGEYLSEINISIDYNFEVLCLPKQKDSSHIICPSHAEKLPNDTFLVSYFAFEIDSRFSLYTRRSCGDGLCIINAEGQMIKIIPGKEDPGFGELYQPWYLAVDQDFAVLVVERTRGRISLLKQNLEYNRELVSSSNGLYYNYRMCLDGANGTLLVSDTDSGDEHVLVYKIKGEPDD